MSNSGYITQAVCMDAEFMKNLTPESIETAAWKLTDALCHYYELRNIEPDKIIDWARKFIKDTIEHGKPITGKYLIMKVGGQTIVTSIEIDPDQEPQCCKGCEEEMYRIVCPRRYARFTSMDNMRGWESIALHRLMCSGFGTLIPTY